MRVRHFALPSVAIWLSAALPINNSNAQMSLSSFHEFGQGDAYAAQVSAISDGVVAAGYNNPGILFDPEWQGSGFVAKFGINGGLGWYQDIHNTLGIYNGSDTYADAVGADANTVYAIGETATSQGVSIPPGYSSWGPTFVRGFDAAGNVHWTDDASLGPCNYCPLPAGGPMFVSVTSSGAYALVSGWTDSGIAEALVRYQPDGSSTWLGQFSSTTYIVALSAIGDTVFVIGTEPGLQGPVSFIRRLDSYGNTLWTKQLSARGAESLSAASDGVYVVLVDMTTSPWTTFLQKYDFNGNELWSRQVTLPANAYVRGVSAASTGVYIGGFISGSDQLNAFVTQFDPRGNQLAVLTFAEPTYGEVKGISAFGARVYLGGTIVTNQFPTPGFDAFVAEIKLAADANSDGVVDCRDVAIVKASFGKKTGQPGFDVRADVNGDGVVDVRDLAAITRLLPAGTACQ